MNRDGTIAGPSGDAIARSIKAIRDHASCQPRIALILGSGLGAYAGSFSDSNTLEFNKIPGFPNATVLGHQGCLVWGSRGSAPVIAQQGRFHLYEGYSPQEIVFPLRVMHALGARTLVVTNAAGSLVGHMAPGDLMLIKDHINFQFASPLRGGTPKDGEERFIDLSEPYSARLLAIASETAISGRHPGIRTGTYWGNIGPAYETPSEIRMAIKMGGHAVGMSTIPEVIVARQLGMEVLGISCITNRAAGLSTSPLSHEEVLNAASRIHKEVSRYLDALLERI